MDLVQVVVLAVLQGLVEFLPISSSGHLILVPALLGWPDQGLAFDIAVHVGTLAAVVFYFRRDLLDLAVAIFQPDRPENKLAWTLVVATLPLVPAGLFGADLISNEFRSPVVIAATTSGFGVLLWFADRFGRGAAGAADSHAPRDGETRARSEIALWWPLGDGRGGNPRLVLVR